MRVIKRTSTEVSGYDGSENENRIDFLLSETIPTDEEPISQDDVVGADALYLTYDSFEDRGEISQEDMHVLLKFGVISGIEGTIFEDWNPNKKKIK